MSVLLKPNLKDFFPVRSKGILPFLGASQEKMKTHYIVYR